MPQAFDPARHPHRRRNPLNGEWLLVSPQRNLRPWNGAADAPDTATRPAHDPACHLCPGNRRATGEANPAYDGVHVFANDFPALLADTPAPPATTDPLFAAAPAQGEARVICFSPDHGKTLAEMPVPAIGGVIDCWVAEAAALGAVHRHVQIFENKGAMMGCSNPHPHGQIWATNTMPHIVATEDANQRAWLAEHGAPLLLRLAEAEAAASTRAVVANAHWLAIVPFWAAWPFETLLLPRFAIARMPELAGPAMAAARADLAQALSDLTIRYDNLFQCSFPYSMGWHGAPFGEGDAAHWQLHAHFYPPLLRSASVRKFMVGYEMLAEAQRDLTPEDAAARLRELPATHYRGRA